VDSCALYSCKFVRKSIDIFTQITDTIEILDIGDNMITEVVKWPKNLKWLRISGNPIRQIPPLPEGLEVFWAEGCVLDEFIRPASLLYLYVARSKTFL
jgi:hypothetical protein